MPCNFGERQWGKFAFWVAWALFDVLATGEATAQQVVTTQQAVSAGNVVENNGEDFTRPQTLFQLRYLYQTAPGSGSVPGAIRTVTTDFSDP